MTDTRHADCVVRPLQSPAEYAASVALQRCIWGAGYQEWVPASIQKLTQQLGGVASGAFDDDGTLIGLVFGMTGVSAGRPVHWSHMLAVAVGARNRGIGRQLKLHQRSLLRAAGVEEIRWTFDPLVARNGHLNLNVLGATVIDYVVDAYGSTGSDLHAFGTDRLVVRWLLSGAACAEGPSNPATGPAPERLDAPLLNAPPGAPQPDTAGAWDVPEVRIQVPPDVEAMRHDGLALACAWRVSTRAAFKAAFGRGYRVAGFRGAPGQPGVYSLRKPGA